MFTVYYCTVQAGFKIVTLASSHGFGFRRAFFVVAELKIGKLRNV